MKLVVSEVMYLFVYILVTIRTFLTNLVIGEYTFAYHSSLMGGTSEHCIILMVQHWFQFSSFLTKCLVKVAHEFQIYFKKI